MDHMAEQVGDDGFVWGVDIVVSNCVLNHARDKPAVWREIFRVLKPGGRFVVSGIFSSKPVPQEFKDDPEAVAGCHD
jgi:arsenite methyltransferase